ncbi:hypothetical protein HNY73_000577 [Argiope bruennichi]|uniref:Uncharacterized protein n=1 Tax=Argiope bruennichi TaxID=94029 RepID=A0A8T0FYI1_ARGBR|nr:hypothetical protein HNY73_000577 [Argiope bruennichi]
MNENYVFEDQSVHSADKLAALREESQASHINRIRFANEKRKRKEAELRNFWKPKITVNTSSKATSKKRAHRGNFSNKNELNQPQLSKDNETKRFFTIHVNNSVNQDSELSGDVGYGHGGDDIQGGIHLISTSNAQKSLKSIKDGSKKRRKQWSKTTKTFTSVEQENNDNRSEIYSEKSLPDKNTQEFNSVQNKRNVESSENIEKEMLTRCSSTERDAKVVQWLESLPPPESGEPILEPVEYGPPEEVNGFHPSSDENIVTKQNDSEENSKSNVGRDRQDTKYSKKSSKKITKQNINVSDLSKTKPKEYRGEKEKMKTVSQKRELSNRSELKTKKGSPLKVTYTPKGNLKVIICLQNLKPKDTALLVWFGDFLYSQNNEENNITSPRKLKKGFAYINYQQMELFENIFKTMNATGDEKSD